MESERSNDFQAQAHREDILKVRDRQRIKSSEVQRNTSELQGAKFEMAVNIGMKRSADNEELVGALNSFVQAIIQQVTRGHPDMPMSVENIQNLTNFLQEKAKELTSQNSN